MRRFVVLFSVATLSLVGGVIGTSAVASGSTDTTPPSEVAATAHPIIGTWLLTVDPESPPELIAFHADGTLHEASVDGSTGMGAWEATGPNSINLTMTEVDEGGFAVVRAAGEVSVDGQGFTADYTIEFTEDGVATGEYGPGQVTGTRINVEPMGEPIGSLDDLFSQFEEEEGTEGTEAAAPPATAATEGTEAAAPPATEMAPPTSS